MSELLDTWDHTFETGNDIESALIIFALAAGAAIAIASAAVLLVTTTKSFHPVHVDRALGRNISELIFSTHSPPVIPLRI